MMRRIVAAGIAALIAASLLGCGGGGADTAGSGDVAVQTQSDPTAAPPSSVAPVSDVVTNTLSPRVAQPFVPFPKDEDVLPQEVMNRLETKQPIMLFFYDASQKTTDDQREAIDAVLADYRGLIDLVSYDVGKYVSSDEAGVVTLDPGMESDAGAKRVANLIGEAYLDITFTPSIVLVDDQGYITRRFRGYVDEVAIEREVLRATQ